MIDQLAPQSATWIRGFSLAPRSPGAIEAVLIGYRLILEAVTYRNDQPEITRIKRAIVDLGGQP